MMMMMMRLEMASNSPFLLETSSSSLRVLFASAGKTNTKEGGKPQNAREKKAKTNRERKREETRFLRVVSPSGGVVVMMGRQRGRCCLLPVLLLCTNIVVCVVPDDRLVDRFSLPTNNDDGARTTETWDKYERRLHHRSDDDDDDGEHTTQTFYFWSETRRVSQWEGPRRRHHRNGFSVNGGGRKGKGAKKDDDDVNDDAKETAARIVREAARRKREATETKEKERIGFIEEQRRKREEDTKKQQQLWEEEKRDSDDVERMERMRKEKEAKERARRKEKEEKTLLTEEETTTTTTTRGGGSTKGGERKEAPFDVSSSASPLRGTPKKPADSSAKEEKKRKVSAPNPLPEPEHHDDVNPDHALNLDDHADVPKRHAPFVDGVVAQFFVFVVTTASIWLKTLFRKLGEYRAAKRREREENEKEMLGETSSGSQIFGSPSRNSDNSRNNSVFSSPVASNPSANHELEVQRVKHAGTPLKKRQFYASRRASQMRIMLIDVNNAQGIVQKWKILGMYFKRLMESSEVFFLARLFISFYYFNAAAEKYAYYVWRFKYYEFNKEHGFPRGQVDLPIGIPYGALLVVVVTTLMVHDIKPSMCCVYLLFWDARESIGLTKEVFFGPNGIAFNELAMKKLSVLGSTTLLLVNTIHSRRILAAQNTDGRGGLLFSKSSHPRTNREVGKPSKLKSIVLALARLALASAFLYVGSEQVTRIAKNDMDAYTKMRENEARGGGGTADEQHLRQKDGHDSNWLLVQFVLALPLFLGLRTTFVCRLMALSLFLEAFLCWDFWNAQMLMPEHARTHFVVNLSCAGGMLLLQMFGAGAYSFDAFLLPKKIV